MHIVNGMTTDFGNFKLDPSAVTLRSLSETEIKLPYTGPLPDQMSTASSAYIHFNVQVAQGVRIVLVADGTQRKANKCVVAASSEEIIRMLEDFFNQDQGDTGVAKYWLGLWQAHYIEWKRIVTGPDRLLTILSTLSVKDREFLQKHMMEPQEIW